MLLNNRLLTSGLDVKRYCKNDLFGVVDFLWPLSLPTNFNPSHCSSPLCYATNIYTYIYVVFMQYLSNASSTAIQLTLQLLLKIINLKEMMNQLMFLDWSALEASLSTILRSGSGVYEDWTDAIKIVAWRFSLNAIINNTATTGFSFWCSNSKPYRIG